MATATKAGAKAQVVLTPTNEPEVKLSAKAQKAVRELRDAHNLEKQIDAIIKVSRDAIFAELGKTEDKFGVDAKGKRLVKIKMAYPTNPVRYNTSDLIDYLAKHHPEVLVMFRTADAEPTPRVLTLN